MEEIIYSNLTTKNTCAGDQCCTYMCVSGAQSNYWNLTDSTCLTPYSCVDPLSESCSSNDIKTVDCNQVNP